jgi:arginase
MMENATISATLIGVPIDLGANNIGVAEGPKAFRSAGLAQKLTGAGIAVTDHGDVACGDRKDLEVDNPKMHYLNEVVRINEEVAKTTDEALRQGHKVIALGGDHSMNLGVVSGASKAVDGNIGLVYLDAHGDMNTDETTLSGNIHGMHLASLMGFGAPELKAVYGEAVKLPKENLLLIGGSDFDQAELELIEREKLSTFTLFDMLSQSLAPLWQRIDELANRVPNIWVSLDLDVIDRMYAPAAGMPNPKGLLYREIATIAEYIGKHAHVIGVDVVEYNPRQDEGNKTAELAIELIAKFFGKEYSWYTSYMSANKI